MADVKLYRIDFSGHAYVLARSKYVAESIGERHGGIEIESDAVEVRPGEIVDSVWASSYPYAEGDIENKKKVGELVRDMTDALYEGRIE